LNDQNNEEQEEISKSDLIKKVEQDVLIYCNHLFIFWKTGYYPYQVDYQITHDLSILIRMWENKEREIYFTFWSKAFSSKKGKK